MEVAVGNVIERFSQGEGSRRGRVCLTVFVTLGPVSLSKSVMTRHIGRGLYNALTHREGTLWRFQFNGDVNSVLEEVL